MKKYAEFFSAQTPYFGDLIAHARILVLLPWLGGAIICFGVIKLVVDLCLFIE